MIILHQLFSTQLHVNRTIRVYLPPSYQKGQRTYPVIYMQDGQNLFDESTAFGRPWFTDKMVDKLPILKQSIIIGIDNGEQSRINEYAPFKKNKGGGQGDAYLDFVVETIKPFIDSNFRTKTSAEHTWIVGASMGGLISYYAGLKFPQVFGKVGVLSPAFWFNPEVLQLNLKTDLSQSEFYIVGSKTESIYMESALQKSYWALKNLGLSDEQIKVIVRDRGKHNESFWARELKKMYLEWI